MYRGLIGCIAGACALTLAASGTAFARAGDRTAAETYPVATALCQKAAASALPARLELSRAQVRSACDTLGNAFGPLVTTVDNAEASYLSTVAAQRALVAAACAKPVTNHAACLAARTTRRTTDATALATRQSAVHLFQTSVENNRLTFWAAIKALRGGSAVAPAS